jgi:hypothetical protein
MFNDVLTKIATFMNNGGKKYGRSRQAIDDSVIRRMHIPCGITESYKHTIGICNTY